MQMKGLYVMGSLMVIHSGREPGIRVPRLESIFRSIGESRITPYVSHTFPLTEYRQAMHAKLSGEGNEQLRATSQLIPTNTCRSA